MPSREYSDRRKFPRYTQNLPVTFQTLAVELAAHCPHCGGELILAGRSLEQVLIQGTGRSTTLSLGGMALELDRGFAPGKQLLLQFPIRNELISVRSVVVVSQRSSRGFFRMGVEFIDLSESQREVLVDYFADNLLEEARDRSLFGEEEDDEDDYDERTDIMKGMPP